MFLSRFAPWGIVVLRPASPTPAKQEGSYPSPPEFQAREQPLAFERKVGQAPQGARYIAHGGEPGAWVKIGDALVCIQLAIGT